MATLLVIEPDEQLAKRLGEACVNGGTHAFEHASEIDGNAGRIAEDAELRVVLLGPGLEQQAALDLARSVADARPDISTLLLAGDVTTDLLRHALRAGLSDVVPLPNGDTADLVTAVAEALTRAERAHEGEAGNGKPTGPCVVTVLSTKGGVGKSVIASNLAVALSKGLQKSVVLVDLDLAGGDMGIMLQIKPVRTIADAALESDHLDDEMLRGFLADHESGVKVLLAPAQPEESAVVSAPRLSRILDLLGEMFSVVVIDTPPILDDRVLTAVDKSDLIFVVATMDVASVKDTRLSLQRLRSLGYGNGSVRLVLNRADSRVWLEAEEIERAVGMQISARIPSDRLVPRSVNKGVPVVTDAPRSTVARSLSDIARLIIQEGGGS